MRYGNFASEEKPSIFPANQSMAKAGGGGGGRGGVCLLQRAALFLKVSQARGQRLGPSRTYHSCNQTKLIGTSRWPSCRQGHLPERLSCFILKSRAFRKSESWCLGHHTGVWCCAWGGSQRPASWHPPSPTSGSMERIHPLTTSC